MRILILALLLPTAAMAQEEASMRLQQQAQMAGSRSRALEGAALASKLDQAQLADAWQQITKLIADGRCDDARSAASQVGDRWISKRVDKKCPAPGAAVVAPTPVPTAPAPAPAATSAPVK